jgi:riboflavin kinase/FMN adenylyltransferase
VTRRPLCLQTTLSELDFFNLTAFSQIVVLRFDATLANQSAAEFAREILKRDLGAVHVVVGAGYRFGRGREGGVDDLQRMGRTYGYGVTTASLAICANGEAFSSTRVRQALAVGDLAKVRAILGRSWSHRAVCIGAGAWARLESGPYPRLPYGRYRVSVRRAGFATLPCTLDAQIDRRGVIHLQWSLAAGRTEVVDVAWMDLLSDDLQLWGV